MQRYRTVHTWVECTSGLNSTCMKDIRIVVQTEYESAMHYGWREGKWSCMLHCLHQQNYNFKSGKVIIPLFSALVRSHISKRILITVPTSGHAFRRIQINWNTMKNARGLEIKLYKERLKEPGSLVKGCLWVGWGGRRLMIAFFKYLKGCHIEEGQDPFSLISECRTQIMDLSYRKADFNWMSEKAS